jgi:hypothetical protein
MKQKRKEKVDFLMKMFYHEGYKGQNSFLEQLSAKSLKGLFQSFFKKSI